MKDHIRRRDGACDARHIFDISWLSIFHVAMTVWLLQWTKEKQFSNNLDDEGIKISKQALS
jgi:hypothetical protein